MLHGSVGRFYARRHKSKPLEALEIDVHIAGVATQVLVDSGATHNFVN